jgi:DNA adenine methylase
VGGGACFFAIEAEKYFINDKSTELMNLYKMISDQNVDFLTRIRQIQHNWDVMSRVIDNHSRILIELHDEYKSEKIDKKTLENRVSAFVIQNADEFNGMMQPEFNVAIQNFVIELNKSFKNKIIRMVEIQKKKGDLCQEDILLNIECSFKTAFYTHFRYLYNHIEEENIPLPFSTAIYFFIREYCYSSMFRYNSRGKFNVPYGGISYNKKSMQRKIEFFTDVNLVNQLNRTTIGNEDFDDFMKKNEPSTDSFVFLDPPYDTEFSTYAKNEFGRQDQIRLANYLKNECNGYFMLVIKNTDFIGDLYPDGANVKNGRRLHVRSNQIKYNVSFQDRNNKKAEHLYITNY